MSTKYLMKQHFVKYSSTSIEGTGIIRYTKKSKHRYSFLYTYDVSRHFLFWRIPYCSIVGACSLGLFPSTIYFGCAVIATCNWITLVWRLPQASLSHPGLQKRPSFFPIAIRYINISIIPDKRNSLVYNSGGPTVP